MTLFTGKPKINDLFDIPQISMKDKKIAIMNFATSQLRNDQLKPRIHILGLLIGIFFDNQNFDCFHILKGDVPKKSQMVGYDAIILPGSTHSVMDQVPEIRLFAGELQ